MEQVEFTFNQERFINILKDLLGCPASWFVRSITQQLTLEIKADRTQVQEEIYTWLSRRLKHEVH